MFVGGRGKRRFARKGVWRTPIQQPDYEPTFWLPPASILLPHPAAANPVTFKGKKLQLRNEYHLAELARQFWGPDVLSVFRSQLISSVHGTLKSSRCVANLMAGVVC